MFTNTSCNKEMKTRIRKETSAQTTVSKLLIAKLVHKCNWFSVNL